MVIDHSVRVLPYAAGIGRTPFSTPRLAFYPRKIGDVEYVRENFISTLKNVENPITETEASKITIEFLTNRTLSPIETGGNE